MKILRWTLALGAALVTLPGVAWAAQTVASVAACCPHCPFGCC